MGQPDYRAVVFDLGGVLVEVPGATAMRELAGLETDEEVWRRWLGCPWVGKFERGECSPDEFAAGVVTDWELRIPPATFLGEFRSWTNRPFSGADELVVDVARVSRVAVLSNMNELHWEYMAGWELLAPCHDLFLSYRLGLVKPDPAIFELVASELEASPAELLFLDDNELNINAALDSGYRARHVRGVADARLALLEERLLPAS